MMDASSPARPRSGEDARGVPLSYANQDAIDGFERALELSLSFRGDAIAEIDKVLEDHPDFIMGWLFKVSWLTQAMETRIYPLMVEATHEAEKREAMMNDRERGYLAAAKAWTLVVVPEVEIRVSVTRDVAGGDRREARPGGRSVGQGELGDACRFVAQPEPVAVAVGT